VGYVGENVGQEEHQLDEVRGLEAKKVGDVPFFHTEATKKIFVGLGGMTTTNDAQGEGGAKGGMTTHGDGEIYRAGDGQSMCNWGTGTR
jgi:hypothetical protein